MKEYTECCSKDCSKPAMHSVSGQQYYDGCYELVKALLDI